MASVDVTNPRLEDDEVEPHPWLGRAADGGSNTPCHRKDCGLPRLHGVHRNFKPEYLGPDDLSDLASSREDNMDTHFTVTDVTERELETLRMLREGRLETWAAGTRSKLPNYAKMYPAVQAWDNYAERVRQLIIDKQTGYGEAWLEQGYMGNLGRVLSKASRLKNLLWRDRAPEVMSTKELAAENGMDGESVMDTLWDLGSLAAFAVQNIEDGNRWGR